MQFLIPTKTNCSWNFAKMIQTRIKYAHSSQLECKPYSTFMQQQILRALSMTLIFKKSYFNITVRRKFVEFIHCKNAT